MISTEIWSAAIGALRANKLKAFLTTLGVVIGSACIVLVVTISLVGRNYIIRQIQGVGPNMVYAELVRNGTQANTLSDEITIGDMEAIRRELPGVSEVAATNDSQMAVVAGGVERPVTLVAVTEGFQRLRHLLVLKGRYFDNEDVQL